MASHTDPSIWFPHEVFYLEALLYCTTAALRAGRDVQSALKTGSRHTATTPEWQRCAFAIMNGVQTITIQAAALSRYFWPSSKAPTSRARAQRLREGLGIGERSPLRSRELRNRWEHFDERLDAFCKEHRAGVVLPSYVGPKPPESEVPTIAFRAYYTDVGEFEILGDRFDVPMVLTAIEEVHIRVVSCLDRGGRIPRSWGA